MQISLPSAFKRLGIPLDMTDERQWLDVHSLLQTTGVGHLQLVQSVRVIQCKLVQSAGVNTASVNLPMDARFRKRATSQLQKRLHQPLAALALQSPKLPLVYACLNYSELCGRRRKTECF